MKLSFGAGQPSTPSFLDGLRFRGQYPTPWGEAGILSIQHAPPGMLAATESLMPDTSLVSIKRFAPSFMVTALAAGVSGYMEGVAGVLVRDGGLDETSAMARARDTWPIIYAGIHEVASTLNSYLTALKWEPEEGRLSPVFVSQMHKWCLAEAANCYVSTMDPGGTSIPQLYADAQMIQSTFAEESMAVNLTACPYMIIAIKEDA